MDGDFALQTDVLSTILLAYTTLADLLLDFVMTDGRVNQNAFSLWVLNSLR